jgi:hypothetical protein
LPWSSGQASGWCAGRLAPHASEPNEKEPDDTGEVQQFARRYASATYTFMRQPMGADQPSILPRRRGGQAVSKSAKSAKHTKADSGRPAFRRRDYGRISVLDRLPEPVKAELRKSWENPEISYPKLLSWLAKEHKTRTSKTALAMFFRRQKECGLLSPSAQAQPGNFPWEVTVRAPGAQSISITLRPLPPGAPAPTSKE